MEDRKTRILLVEDDISFGKILKDYLSLNSFDVMHMKDGVDGWQTFRNHHFDLCILDVMLPKRDGYELAQQIRKENTSVPIFFLTAKGQKADMLAGYENGADDYIVKPVDADILMHKIKAILKRSHEPVAMVKPSKLILSWVILASILSLGYWHWKMKSKFYRPKRQSYC